MIPLVDAFSKWMLSMTDCMAVPVDCASFFNNPAFSVLLVLSSRPDIPVNMPQERAHMNMIVSRMRVSDRRTSGCDKRSTEANIVASAMNGYVGLMV